MRLLDPRFAYKSAAATDIRETFKRHGFKPTTDEDRKRAQEKLHGKSATVTDLNSKRRK
jgi:hypothetical protein